MSEKQNDGSPADAGERFIQELRERKPWPYLDAMAIITGLCQDYKDNIRSYGE